MAKAREPDWRNRDAEAPELSTSRPWQAHDTKAPASRGPSRRFWRRAIVLTTLVSLAIGFGILLRFIQGQRPSCMIVVGSGYEHNLLLPHNVYGWNGARNVLKSLTPDDQSTWQLVRDVFGQASGIRDGGEVSLAGLDWPKTWEEIDKRIKKGNASGGDNEQVILYFSMHGYADEHDVYLLRDVPNIKSLEEFNASRVPFSAVLNSLQKDVPSKKGIVLILDVCHVKSHWPIGMLQNDFVEQLEKKYGGSINDMENLTVICSTGPRERSWASEERKTTIFAEAVAKALRGEGHEADSRITAATLHAYVSKEVNEWAKANRARKQEPIRLGEANPELTTVARPAEKDDAAGKDGAGKDDAKKEAPKGDPIALFPENMKSAWDTWLNLKTHDAPQVYAPHYWRLYQETLLRYEQLMRAGDPTSKADLLKTKLDLLKTEIEKDKKMATAFDCLGNSFPMPRVLGYPLAGASPKEILTIQAQWNKPDVDKPDVDRQKWALTLKPFADKKDPEERRYWQTELSQRLLRTRTGQPDFKYDSVHDDLAKIATELGVPPRPNVPQRSAEVHLVNMLQNVDPTLVKEPAHVKCIKLAMEVRMLAEEAALGGPSLNEPSELYAEVLFQRMRGLKDADEKRRLGEDRLVGNPTKQSGLALKKLEEAREAYQKIRDDAKKERKALALRDDIAAELPFLAVSLATLDAKMNKTVESLRGKVHALGNGLAELTKYLDKPGEKQPDLPLIESDLQSARDQYHTLCQFLAGLDAKTQKNWHAIDAVLIIPPTAATDEQVKLRLALLKKRRDTSQNLDGANRPEGQAEKPESNVEIQRELLRSSLRPFAEQIQGAMAKTNVDDNVREFYLGQFHKTLEASGKLEDEVELQSAVGRSRVLLGCQADQLIDERKERINPAKRLRQLRTYKLLLGLAQRTLDDHWWEPGINTKETYYVPAASAYVAAAKSLEPKGAKNLKERTDLEGKLSPSGVITSGQLNLNWTTETTFDLTKFVDLEKGVPAEGLVTTWFEVAGNDKVRETEPTPRRASESVTLTPQLAKLGTVPVKLHALFRGQHVVEVLPLKRPQPDIIVRDTPGPNKVGFAVRMDEKLDYGAISFVIDNSGSMGTLHPRKGEDRRAKPGENSRYDYAVKAIKQVLQKLPEDTYLSISTFNTKNNSNPEFIEIKLREPSDIPYRRWKLTYLKDLEETLKNQSLYNNSPIAKAIINSMEKGFPPTFKGPRLVVVLTDGMDNYSYDKDAWDEKNKDAQDRNTTLVKEKLFKAKLYHRDVEVVVVCFIAKDDREFESAKDQFKLYADDGRLFVEAKGSELGKKIEEILKPRIQLSEVNGGVVPKFEAGRHVNYRTGTLTWEPSLDAADYMASILKSPGPGVPVKMANGQNLFAMLKRDESRFVLERGIIGLQPEIRNKYFSPMKNAEDWLVTLLGDEQPPNKGTRTNLIAFEKISERGKLRSFPPGLVWLELITPDKKRFGQTLAWGNDIIVPAPAFSAEWPLGNARLNAWYATDTWSDLLSSLKITPKRYTVGGNGDDIIESVRWEEDFLIDEMHPEGLIPGKRKCLVVRARYQGGEPVYIGLRDKSKLPRVGSEHRFYDEAGRCTAAFYGLGQTIEEIDLVVIPVSAFKSIATRVDFPPSASADVPDIFRGALLKAIYGK